MTTEEEERQEEERHSKLAIIPSKMYHKQRKTTRKKKESKTDAKKNTVFLHQNLHSFCPNHMQAQKHPENINWCVCGCVRVWVYICMYIDPLVGVNWRGRLKDGLEQHRQQCGHKTNLSRRWGSWALDFPLNLSPSFQLWSWILGHDWKNKAADTSGRKEYPSLGGLAFSKE